MGCLTICVEGVRQLCNGDTRLHLSTLWHVIAEEEKRAYITIGGVHTIACGDIERHIFEVSLDSPGPGRDILVIMSMGAIRRLLYVSCGKLPRKHTPDLPGSQCAFRLVGRFVQRINEAAFSWQPLSIAHPISTTVMRSKRL